MRPAVLLCSALAVAACARNPQPATPAPAPAAATPVAAPATAAAAPAPAAAPAAAAVPAAASVPAAAVDLAGTWDFTVDAGGQVIAGEILMTRSGATYTGTVSPQGMGTLDIRSVTIAGMRVVIVVATPDGDAVMDATLTEDRRAMSGAVAVQGQPMPFSARRR
jgi:hypothetical protein